MAVVISVCALAGAIAGIAGSAAAPSKSKSQAQAAAKAKKQALAKRQAFRQGFRGRMHRGFAFGIGGPGGPMGGPVHSEVVVPKPDDSGFFTITMDSGTLNGVDGTTVDLKEGTDKATYNDSVKIDVGGDAKVFRNGKEAKLSDLQPKDHVHVIQGGPKGNVVMAADDAFIAQQKQEHHWGPKMGPPPGDPDGPPGAPGGYPGDKGQNQNGSDSGSSGSGTNS